MIKKAVLFIIVCVIVFSFLSINLKAEIKFKGLFQGWFSYAEQDGTDDDGVGFTLRRLRFKPYGSLGKNISWGFQVAWDKQKASVLDAYINFKFSDQFQLKFGQFAAPGSVSGSLTSSGSLDMVERPQITQIWGSFSDLSSYRALGAQLHGNLASGKVYYAVMVANPNTTSLFNPGVKSSNYTHERNGVALWSRVEVKPTKCLRIGGFFGTNKDDDDYVTNSYGGNLFFNKSGFNFKVEFIGGEHGYEGLEVKYNGLYALLGYKINKIEPIVRFDFYKPNKDNSDGFGVETYNNLTVGINYFYSDSIKFQANYVFRDESMVEGLAKLKNDLFYVCFQYTYN